MNSNHRQPRSVFLGAQIHEAESTDLARFRGSMDHHLRSLMVIEFADDISRGHEFVEAPDEIGVPAENERHAVGHAGDVQPAIHR